MSNYNNFKDFYEKQLLSDLKVLDRERKKVDRSVLIILITTLVIILIEGKFIPSDIGPWQGIIQVTTGIIGFILISISSKKYRLGK